MRKYLLLAIFLLGCSPNKDEDELRTVPVTNNPQIVPNYGSPFPGMQTAPR